MSARPEPMPLADPRGVDPGRIENALRELWQSAESDGNAPAAVVRACGLTVVSVARDPGSFDELVETVGSAAHCVPARTIFVLAGPAVEGGLHAEVSAFCTIGGPAGKQVCHEVVTVRAAEERLRDLPPLLTPLVVQDLPFVVLATRVSDLVQPPLDRLAAHADIVVADSARDADDALAWRAIATLRADRRVSLRDLAFDRGVTWREVVADLYDETVGAGAALDAIEIETPGERADVTLLEAWIAMRLGDRQAGLVRRVRLDPASGASLGVAFVGRRDGTALRAGFRQYGRHVARVEEHGGDESCALPRPVPDDAELIAGLLLTPEADRDYERVVDRLLPGRAP